MECCDRGRAGSGGGETGDSLVRGRRGSGSVEVADSGASAKPSSELESCEAMSARPGNSPSHKFMLTSKKGETI
jgi:hypothetical protein